MTGAGDPDPCGVRQKSDLHRRLEEGGGKQLEDVLFHQLDGRIFHPVLFVVTEQQIDLAPAGFPVAIRAAGGKKVAGCDHVQRVVLSFSFFFSGEFHFTSSLWKIKKLDEDIVVP